MTQHDKHQYYFEKYLRNEMPQDEREAFDEKLAADAALRMAFEYYKLNRQKLLEQLIEEHQLAKRDNRLNKLIFLLISLTGIALVVNHLVYKNEELSRLQNEKPKNIFVRYIPFLNWENRTDKKVEEVKHPKPAAPLEEQPVTEEVIETLEPSVDRNERLSSDEFVADTFVTIWEKSYYDKMMAFRKQNDSLGLDSMSRKMAATLTRDKSKKLLVEFWESPVNYKGYLYHENKLVLYGLPYPTKFYIYKSRDTSVAVLPWGAYPLIEQPKFIAF